MSREIESNNKDHPQASIDTQRDYDPPKSLRNVSKSKNVTRQNIQPENHQRKEDCEEFISDEDEEYSPKEFTHIPEKVLGKKVIPVRISYFVKWQGLPKTANTWEELKDLEVNYQGLIDKFELKYKLQEDKKKELLDPKQNAQTPNKQKVYTKMSREIESNNKDHQEAAVDAQRGYDPHKSHRNVSKSKTVTEKNTQPENPQQEEDYEDEEYSPKEFTHIPEKVLGKKVIPVRISYFVKWQGLPKTANTWEKLKDLEAKYQGIIDKYEMLYKLQEDKKKKILIAKQNDQKQLSQAKPQALIHSVTAAVPQPSSKSKKYTEKDIQEMLGRHTLDNEVVYAVKLKSQSEVKYVQKKDLDCPDLIKEADRKYQEELKTKSQNIGTQSSTGRSKRRRKMNSNYADDSFI